MPHLEDSAFMALAAAAAERFIGATQPNPPVGACLVKDGRVLAVGAHERCGTDHAEVVALKRAWETYGRACSVGATMYSTLEPCNHTGKTPPCARTLIEAGVKRVVYGLNDPHAYAAGGDAALRAAGVAVTSGVAREECARQLRPFLKLIQTGMPWVVHKLAYRMNLRGELTMIPEAGATTFTSPESLKLAHEERRKCDALLTGLGTIVADAPRFSVRHMPDHAGKRRMIAVVTRSGMKAPEDWTALQTELGNEVIHFTTAREALTELGRRGCLSVLVEAGPRLSQALVEEKLWDERLVFVAHRDKPDTVLRELACSPES